VPEKRRPTRPERKPPAEDVSMRDKIEDRGSYQSNHATTGTGSDDERSDPDDAKVKGQSRG
jgi:hypothetical protein